MPQQTRAVVIGAGVIGLNVAWRLAEQGAKVTLVDAASVGSGTSSTSFAWLNASSKVDYTQAYFDLNAAALREHAALAATTGTTTPPWAHFNGDVEIGTGAAGAAALADKVRRLRAMGYAAEPLSASELNEIEPGTRLGPDDGAAFYREEGWVDTGSFIAALLGFCRSAGVVVIERDAARKVMQAGGRVVGVVLASGSTIEADVVVTALGRWTADFAASLDIAVPLVAPEPVGSRAIGLLARVVPENASPRRLLHSDGINWSPLADGWALLASDSGDKAVAGDRSPDVADRAAHDLVAAAAALNPLFANAKVEQATIGIRALPSDDVAICGWAPDLGNLYIAVTHSGMTLSPLIGKLVAREVIGGEEAASLATFRPDRFRAGT